MEWNWHSASWRHCCLENCWVSASFLGKVLDLNTNLISLRKLPMGSTAVRLALCVCFSLFFCPIAGLQLSIGRLKIVGTVSFSTTSWRSLKEGPCKTPDCSMLFEAVSGKLFSTNPWMLRGRKAVLFIFVSHSLLTFNSILGELQSANFGFWVVFLWSSLWIWNQTGF